MEDADGFANYRHTSFGVKVIVENWDAVKKNGAAEKTYVRWEAQRDRLHRIGAYPFYSVVEG
jgi:hypothetical protein